MGTTFGCDEENSRGKWRHKMGGCHVTINDNDRWESMDGTVRMASSNQTTETEEKTGNDRMCGIPSAKL